MSHRKRTHFATSISHYPWLVCHFPFALCLLVYVYNVQLPVKIIPETNHDTDSLQYYRI